MCPLRLGPCRWERLPSRCYLPWLLTTWTANAARDLLAVAPSTSLRSRAEHVVGVCCISDEEIVLLHNVRVNMQRCVLDSLPEWSKGFDSRNRFESSNSESCTGSNPVAVMARATTECPYVCLSFSFPFWIRGPLSCGRRSSMLCKVEGPRKMSHVD